MDIQQTPFATLTEELQRIKAERDYWKSAAEEKQETILQGCECLANKIALCDKYREALQQIACIDAYREESPCQHPDCVLAREALSVAKDGGAK